MFEGYVDCDIKNKAADWLPCYNFNAGCLTRDLKLLYAYLFKPVVLKLNTQFLSGL